MVLYPIPPQPLETVYCFICGRLRVTSGGFRGGRKGRSPPPPPKIGQKKESVLISPFPHIWWLKMQNFLGSLRSPALFNIILNIALLKNLENNTCSYILSSFYMVAIEEGNFDMKMQDFWTLNR